MRLMTCVFESADAFLDSYSVESSEGVLYCRTRSALAVGELLVVEVSFPGLANRTLVRGAVSAVKPGRGAWVRLHPADADTRDFLLAFARGEVPLADQVERGYRRIPIALPVTCHIEEVDEPRSERLLGMTHDVGGGGAWVEAAAAPAVGTRVSLVLGPLDARGDDTIRLDGRVAWLRRGARKHGFGVRFDTKGCGDARRLRGLLRRACESGWVGFGWADGAASRTRG